MNIIIGNAWPYANGHLHLGRIAVLLPGDILARYHRAMGDDVVFVSGSDSHGTPVTMRAKEEGLTPEEVCNKYHNDFLNCFSKLNFSFDFFTKTHTKYHSDKVKEFILELYKKGYIYEKDIEQVYCENCKEVLQDRYIEGICPHCVGQALGDQCLECSEILESDEILDKRCKFCGSKPKNRKTNHLFFALSKFEKDVRRIFIKEQGWRENAIAITKRYLDEGLRDRAVTRDFNWGIDVPLDGYEDKKIYVWIEAVMGYLTASMKVLEERNEDYREYWNGEDSRVYFVHGKDNIPFHTVIFPAILAGLDINNPNIRVISSEYLKLEGKQFSSAKNWVVWGNYIVDKYNPDAVRYYLIKNGPEKKDEDFTWKDFINTNNTELVGLYGNLVNRTLSFVKNNFNGEIPKGKMSKELKDRILNLYFRAGDLIEEGEFKEALVEILDLIKEANRFFDNERPWITIKNNREICSNSLYITIQLILNISNLLDPFMPTSSEKIRNFLGIDKAQWSYTEINSGKISDISILFEKIDKEKALEEVLLIKKGKI